MARLRFESAPEITVNDEALVIKAANGATAPLIQFKDSSDAVIGNITSEGVLNVTSVVASNAGTGSTALATREYVDSVAAGANWHKAVTAATSGPIANMTYNNGTAGVGATLTASVNGALVLDDVTLENDESVLVKDQSNSVHNGIYTVTDKGSASTPIILTRRDDSDNSPEGEVAPRRRSICFRGNDKWFSIICSNINRYWDGWFNSPWNRQCCIYEFFWHLSCSSRQWSN